MSFVPKDKVKDNVKLLRSTWFVSFKENMSNILK